MDTTTSQLLTHSRMACAKACLRRHYYSFEMRLRPRRESEALTIGRAFHDGLEAFGACRAPDFDGAVLAALKAATRPLN